MLLWTLVVVRINCKQTCWAVLALLPVLQLRALQAGTLATNAVCILNDQRVLERCTIHGLVAQRYTGLMYVLAYYLVYAPCFTFIDVQIIGVLSICSRVQAGHLLSMASSIQ
jgi:hypothetical protein